MASKLAAKPEITSVAFVSLGCPKNLVDSERMLGLLASDGLAIAPGDEPADAIVINTCGFLEASKEESFGEIHRAIELKNKGLVKRVIVAGCLVQRHKTKLLDEAPGIDRLVGVFDREHIVEAVRGKANPHAEHGHYLGKYHDLTKLLEKNAIVDGGMSNVEAASTIDSPQSTIASPKKLPLFEDDRARLRLTPRHYAYLRISEGCNQGCAFCTIPSIRGPMRSKPLEQIMAEARELAADGAVELNLIGQDTTSYGTDIGYAPGLAGLLKVLSKQIPADVLWLRLMYAYPSVFSDDMIRALADSDRFVKYIDMPLQHASNRLLNVMRRRVTLEHTSELLDKLRLAMPGIGIRTTFIAGNPGETEEEHQMLVDFVKTQQFEHVGVFAYSPEPGTAMGRMDGQLPDEEKQRRVEDVMLAQQDVVFARNSKRVGEKHQVIIDRPAGRDLSDGYVARTAFQAPDIDSVTYVASKKRLASGDVINVEVTDFQNYDLIAKVPQDKRKPLAVLK